MPSVFTHTARMRTVTYKISYALKCLVTLSAFGGVILSLFTAKKDGYSHWSRRLLYFTAQSNIWLGVTFLLLALLPFHKNTPPTYQSRLYVLKYVFTVSIAITGLVFCGLLAPFSDETYRPWTVCNVFTHVITPTLAIADYFLDDFRLHLTTKHVFLSTLPPLAYCLFSSVLGAFHTDFGRGVEYPYFFLNYRSPAGIFGFSDQRPFFVGTFYWIVLFLLVVLGLGFLLLRNDNKKMQ